MLNLLMASDLMTLKFLDYQFESTRSTNTTNQVTITNFALQLD